MTKKTARAGMVALLAAAAVFVVAGHSEAGPALTAAQREKLKRIEALFARSGSGTAAESMKWVEKHCGASVPIEIDASTVVVEEMNGERTAIPDTCKVLPDSLVAACGSNPNDSNPVAKEIVRSSVKKMVCKATADQSSMNNTGVKYELNDGTFTVTYAPNRGFLDQEAEKALRKNARLNGKGVSLGGHLVRLRTLEQVNKGLRLDLKKDCGIDVSVTIEDALADEYADHVGYSLNAVCDHGLQSVYNFCARPGEFESFNKTAVKAELTSNLKSLVCARSKTKNQSIDYKNGVLTIGESFDSVKPIKPGTNDPWMDILDFYMDYLKNNASGAASKTPSLATNNAPKTKKRRPR